MKDMTFWDRLAWAFNPNKDWLDSNYYYNRGIRDAARNEENARREGYQNAINDMRSLLGIKEETK